MPSPQMVQLAPDVQAYIQPDGGWWVSNAGVIAGHGGTVLIDTAATETRTQSLLVAALSIGGGVPVAAVITHAHGDHAGGLSMLGDVPSYATAACAGELRTAGLNHWPMLFPDVCWGDIHAVTPSVPVSAPTQVTQSVPTLTVTPIGRPAHSPGDLTAWLPEYGILFAGDLAWSAVTPLCVLGSITAWAEELATLKQLAPAVVVPGHGQPGGVELLAATQEYLHEVIELATIASASGWTVHEALDRHPFTSVHGWLEPERHVVNLHQAIAELQARPLDLPSAVGDLVRAYGGTVPTQV